MLIYIVINWQSVYSYFVHQPEPFIIEGCSVGGIDISIVEAIKEQKLGIPDYKVNLFFQPLQEKIQKDEDVKLKLDIVDEGILKLNNSYFYILLYDPDNNFRAVFPCFCEERPTALGIDAYCSTTNGRTQCSFMGDDNPRADKWPTNYYWENKNGDMVRCKNNDYVCLAQSCHNPNELISGEIDNQKILYRYKVDEVGTWKAFVILWEEEPKTRDYGVRRPYSEYDIEDRAIALTEIEFRVVNEVTEVENNFLLSQITRIVIAVLSYFALVVWFYEPIRRFCTRHKRKIIEIVIILIVVAIVSKFFCLASCPIR